MNRNIFTTRRNIRRACFDLAGAAIIVCVGVVALLAYFDILYK